MFFGNIGKGRDAEIAKAISATEFQPLVETTGLNCESSLAAISGQETVLVVSKRIKTFVIKLARGLSELYRENR